MKSDIEQEYIADIIASRYPVNEPVGIVEVGELTRDPAQFSATATKREDGVGFVEGAAPAPSSSSVAQVSQPRFGRGGVTAEQSAAAGGLEKPLTALADMGGGIARGITAQTMGLAGDIESLYNGLTSIFNRPEDQPRIDAFLQGLAQKTNMATTEQINKEGYRIPFTDINMPPLPPVVPAGSSDQKSREASANYGQAFGELAPIPSVVDVGVAGLKAGAKALAPSAASMMEQGLRKSGMIADIVPDGKSVAQQAAKSDIGFYSAVENAAINVQRKSGTGQSFLNDIMKGENVKAEEIKWIGLDEFLKGKKNVTKQEVQDYIANNKVDVKEVTLGGNKNTFTDPEKAIAYIGEREGWTPREVMENWGYADKKDYIDLANEMAQKDPTNGSLPAKFGSYTLAGGENYREILLTTPTEKSPFDKFLEDMSNKYGADTPRNQWSSEDNIALDKYIKGDYYTDAGYRSSHFDQPNILAHLRVNDRVDADGKKMLLIEEVQSDWHQAGRNKGYRQGEELKAITYKPDDFKISQTEFQYVTKDARGNERVVGKGVVGSEQDAKEYFANWLTKLESEKATESNIARSKQVPDAPFKDTWYQLALKRALQYAAENGYERVGLTTGTQQAARYDLAKQVNEIVVPMVNSDGTRSVRIEPVDGSSINLMLDENGIATGFGQAGRQFTDKKIDEIVGKELADKIMKADAESKFSGIDLSVGGEGMKKYYDEIYPKFLEKYGKKWNAKIGATQLNGTLSKDELAKKLTGNPTELYKYLPSEDKRRVDQMFLKDGESVRYIDITPEMKAGVQKGQPLFAAAPIGAATGTAAMQDERKK